jgi:hypothetical protein
MAEKHLATTLPAIEFLNGCLEFSAQSKNESLETLSPFGRHISDKERALLSGKKRIFTAATDRLRRDAI